MKLTRPAAAFGAATILAGTAAGCGSGSGSASGGSAAVPAKLVVWRMGAYNEFIVALTFLGQAHSSYTLPIYVTYFFGRGGAEWGPIMAASTLYTIPVVVFFLLVQRRMTGGLVAGAVKG